MKKVSIIVPVYNREKSIKDCYDSLVRQTYKNLEIILVDDGSLDGTLEVIKSFKDERVKVFSQENAGPAEARRHGFNESTGDYICFVDSDDGIADDFIERLVDNLEKTGSSICMGRIGLYVNYPVIKKVMFKAKKKPKIIEINKDKKYLPALSQGIVGKLFKREILNLKKIEFRANEDLVIMYPLYVKIGIISVDNDAIYYNYYSRNSQRNLLFGYKFLNIYNTFGTLKLVYDEYQEMGKLEEYYDEIEMLFIRNIFERINNVSDSVSDKEYKLKFVSMLLDYLECFFSDWDKNEYYLDGFKLGEYTDRLRILNAKKIIKKIDRKKSTLSIEEVYSKYQELEQIYENRSK